MRLPLPSLTLALPLLALPLPACSEYEVTFKDDDPAGVDEPVCEEPDLSPGVVEVDEACSTAIAELEPVLEWEARGAFDVYNTPVVGQLTDDNGDGLVDDLDVPDIVVISQEGYTSELGIALLSGDGSGIHWTRTDLVMRLTQPAIGDVNGDGRPDIIAAHYVDDYRDGYSAFDGRTGEIIWTADGDGDFLILNPDYGTIGLYDLEGDGTVEVVLGHTIFEGATGELRAIGEHGNGSARPYELGAPQSVAADLDLDGVQEILAGNAAYGPDGETLWFNSERDGAVAVGNFDEDPEGEMVAVSYTGEVRLQDTDGSVIWRAQLEEPALGPPSIADVDGDGRPEIAIAGSVWLYSLDADGQLMWTHPISAICAGGGGVSAFDFNGDGVVEWVTSDDFDTFILDGPTGAVRARIEEHSHRSSVVYPTIADVDRDGSAELIVANALWTGPERGVQVFGHPRDGWMPSRAGWNQHGYGRTQADEVGHIITEPEAPWLSQNSFRAGELSVSEFGSEPLPDAALRLGEACACEADLLRVVARVANEGVAELPAGLRVSIGLGENGAWLELGVTTTTAPVAPGETSEGLVFDLDPEQLYSETLELRLDTEDLPELIECDLDNNALRFEVPTCEG